VLSGSVAAFVGLIPMAVVLLILVAAVAVVVIDGLVCGVASGLSVERWRGSGWAGGEVGGCLPDTLG
jgi:hypothetical protein